MIPKKYPLACGGTLSVCRTDKFKAGMLSVSLVLPIERERTWMTSLLLSVLRRGTEKYPTLAAINRQLDYLYGTELSIRNFYRGDCQIVGFSADLLGSAFLPDGEALAAEVLDVMHQILFCPLLDANGCLDTRYVESEKKQQCDHIRALKNSPRGYASERCRSILYRNEPCGASVYGEIEAIERVTAEELTAHWRWLLSVLHLDCFYVGAESAERIRAALDVTFGAVNPAVGKQEPPPLPTVVRTAEEIVQTEETLAAGQSQLVLALRTGITVLDPAYYACMVANEMLGNSPISKLFVQVRERLSLCYFCSSHYNSYKGTLLIHCGLDAKDREAAEEAILAQLRAMANGEFSREELLAAKQSIQSAYRQLEDSPAALESFYFGRSLLGLKETVESTRKRFGAVTREDVIAAVRGMTVDVVYFLRGTLAQKEDDDEDN